MCVCTDGSSVFENNMVQYAACVCCLCLKIEYLQIAKIFQMYVCLSLNHLFSSHLKLNEKKVRG